MNSMSSSTKTLSSVLTLSVRDCLSLPRSPISLAPYKERHLNISCALFGFGVLCVLFLNFFLSCPSPSPSGTVGLALKLRDSCNIVRGCVALPFLSQGDLTHLYTAHLYLIHQPLIQSSALSN